MLRNHRTYRRQVYKTGSVFSIGPTTARYLILILLAVFSLLFLIEAAQGSDGLIELRGLEQQKTELNNELKGLQINKQRLDSLPAVSEAAKQQGMVPVEGSLETITVTP